MTLTAIMNTERSTRKAANSEKDWLDFAVRELSRVVAGKEKGQEQIWNIKYKPVWWDSEVKAITNSYDARLAWKNPTTNPKDRKGDLIIKYTILSKMLRAENKFPKDLEEEAELWESGRIKELLLLTKVVSITSNTHSINSDMEEVFDLRNESSLKIPHISRTINRNKASIIQIINNYLRLLKVSTSGENDLGEDVVQNTTAHLNLIEETMEPDPGTLNTSPHISSSTCNLTSKRKSLCSEHFVDKKCRLESQQEYMSTSSCDTSENSSSDLFNHSTSYLAEQMTSTDQNQNHILATSSFASFNTHLNTTDLSNNHTSADSNVDLEETPQRDSAHCKPIQSENICNTLLQESTTSLTSISHTFSSNSLNCSDVLLTSPTNQLQANYPDVSDESFMSFVFSDIDTSFERFYAKYQ
ncbi:uncharacterized protein LOC131952521 isoform X2 [Physella acuta]|uniref:uncharacterized protein LOC131952521 isoform X2 n=1 Tax=Physella acuta TaxID=109671 RepID=UPI0027DB82B8|nr:uncharacterized protein LOC131952521 isoform X2 [Physella acuta]XP_059171209.1 uncharacterized protein LOC131952521 isoform X2 [Physella acuta]